MSYRSQGKGTNYRKPKPHLHQTLSPVPNHLKTKTGVDLSKSTTSLGSGMEWVGDTGLDNEELVERTKTLKAGEKWEPPVSGFCPTCKSKHKPPEPPEPPEGDEKQPPQPPPKVTEIDESHSGEDGGGGGGGQQQQQPPPPQKGKGEDKDEEEKDEEKGKDGEGTGKDDKKDKDTKEGDNKKDGKGKDGQDKKDQKDKEGESPNEPQKGKDTKDGKPKGGDESGKKPYVPEGTGEDEEEPSPDAPTPEDIQKAKAGGDEVKGEFDQANKVDLDNDTPDFESVAGAADPTLYRDAQFMAEMNTALKDWKTGYETKTGASGSRLSVKQFIKTVGNEPFLTRIQKSAKGRKILFVVDLSGSQYPTQEEYKKALVSTSEVLDGIGSLTAMFAFGSQAGQDHQASFLRVKRFEEQKWMPVHSARVSALEAGGGTPTHAAYRALNTYIRRHKPDVVITLTDGEPDDDEATTREIQRLRPMTKMVAFGIGDSLESAQVITEKLSKYGYNRVFGVTGVAGLPSKIVGLIAPKN